MSDNSSQYWKCAFWIRSGSRILTPGFLTLGLFLCLPWLVRAEAPAPNPSRLPAPTVSLPDLPDNGSGVYRLNLDQALGAAPLTLVMHVEGGKVIRAAGLPVRNAQAWCPVDASRLAYRNGRLAGKVSVELLTVFDPKTHRRNTLEGKPNPKFERYELKPVLTVTFDLEVQCERHGGQGTYTATWSGDTKSNPYGPWMKRGEQGLIHVMREPVRPLPATWQADLFLQSGLADVAFGEVYPWRPFIFLRADARGIKIDSAAKVVVNNPKGDAGSIDRLTFQNADFTIRNGKVSGQYVASVEGLPAFEFSLDLEGLVIGRRLVGTATVMRGNVTATTQWMGFLHDVSAWSLPLELQPARWDWQHDAAADQTLAARALAESQQPVMPGVPSRAGFWTWRKLTPHQPVSVIHPPCFDLRESPDAASYRFTITGKTAQDMPVQGEFTADKPWRPLIPVWKELPPGTYSLTVTGLDAAGKELPGPMRMGILDKATAKRTTTDLKSIAFVKRPSFAGPYAKVERSWNDTALAMSRWHRAHPGLYERCGIGISPSGNAWTTGGDHGYGVAVADRLWSTLAGRALTNDVAERLLAEEMLAFNAEDLELHQRFNKPAGYIHDYQAHTPLAYWIGTAILDAWLTTGDERWRAIALKLGRAIVDQQKENGAFYSLLPDIRDPSTRRGPHGFFTWREGATEFGAAEVLYLLGRMRRDLQTDEFVVAETKAYEWVMEHGVRERFWPINVSHSMNSGYPIWQHPVAGLCFSRYLLECAPSERRDMKLAIEVARWAEDVGVDWTRAAEGKQTGPITPRIEAIDRYNNDPIAVNLLAAVVFEELGQATGDKLWSAKAHSLAMASLQATEPTTGRPASNLIPNAENHCTIARGYGDPAHYRHWDFCNGWATQLLREYAALKQ